MPVFYVNKENVSENELFIEGDDARHIARSLRMAEGDGLRVCDGEGTEYFCTLTRIRDERCDMKIEHSGISKAESPVDITLYMAYPKSDKLETVIQKAAELGAKRIIPFYSSRCIKRPSEEKAEKRLARLNKIAKEASGQCGRATVATVGQTLSFSEMLSEAKNSELALFCYEGNGTVSVKELLKSKPRPKTVSVIVGSEGGFSPEEANAAEAAGLIPIGLGGRILRCETAPSFILSVLSYVFEL